MAAVVGGSGGHAGSAGGGAGGDGGRQVEATGKHIAGKHPKAQTAKGRKQGRADRPQSRALGLGRRGGLERKWGF